MSSPTPFDAAGKWSDAEMLTALRMGDESAFAALIERYNGSLLRLARLYVPSQAAAEDAVQETWLGVLRGLNSFEGRSSLKTWIYHILLNRARTRGQREARSVPFSTAFEADADTGEPAVDPSMFTPDGWWGPHPRDWGTIPEERLLSQETREVIDRAIAQLSPNQREVITLRDVEGLSSEDVRNALGVSETNQRVLLHRARSKVRQALEQYLGEG